MNRTEDLKLWVTRIAEAALTGDQQRVEILMTKAIRSLKQEHPDLGSELGALLSRHSVNPGSLRWKESGPPPADPDQGFALVRTDKLDSVYSPILPEVVARRVEQFLRERRESQRLLVEGFTPSRSLLLVGAPGTGKTMLARWCAVQLNLPLVTLDLATAISSFLGKTGFNLRRVLDYARSKPCVLLLDEFDSIAKRRDDATELGELKRIVNVLLKELEDWPMHSVLVAATNHPELLDIAIRRRFDVSLDLPLPGDSERVTIMERAGGRFAREIPGELLRACSNSLRGVSASDIDSLMQAAIRHHLSAGFPLAKALIGELHDRFGSRFTGKSVGVLVRCVHAGASGSLSVRDLAELFGKSPSTIQHHLAKESTDG
jgi:SpoVK/Ycf46/Vps4 family AAA+-type ATPase